MKTWKNSTWTAVLIFFTGFVFLHYSYEKEEYSNRIIIYENIDQAYLSMPNTRWMDIRYKCPNDNTRFELKAPLKKRRPLVHCKKCGWRLLLQMWEHHGKED